MSVRVVLIRLGLPLSAARAEKECDVDSLHRELNLRYFSQSSIAVENQPPPAPELAPTLPTNQLTVTGELSGSFNQKMWYSHNRVRFGLC